MARVLAPALALLLASAVACPSRAPCKVSDEVVAALPNDWEDGDDVFDAEVSLLQVNMEMKRDVRHEDTLRSSRHSALQLSSQKRETSGVTTLYTSMRCTVVLTAQFMVIYVFALLMKIREALKAGPVGEGPGFVEKLSWNNATIPLVMILMILLQVRAEQLSERNTPWDYGIPQWWAEAGLLVAALAGVVALGFQLLALISTPHDGGSRNMASNFFAGCHTLSSGVQYLGIAVMVVAALFMVEPYDVWLNNGHIGISAEVASFTNIAIQCFVIHSVLLVATGIQELSGGGAGNQAAPSVVVKMASAGARALRPAPMLCILIVGARARAMEVLRGADMEQDAADVLCYAAAHALLVHLVLTCAAAAVEPGAGKPGEAAEQPSFGSRVLAVLMGLAMLCVHVSAVGLFIYIFSLSGPGGWKAAPEFNAVLACTLVLAVQHFGVDIVAFLGGMFKGRQAGRGSRAMIALARASEVNTILPILSGIFLVAGARAAEFGGLPQNWMQMCMYGCIVLAAMILLLAIGVVVLAEPAPGGAEREEGRPKFAAYFLAFVQVFSVAGLYALMAAILCGLFSMSSSNVHV